MTQYLFKFIFYTSGVIGILLIGYVVAKNFLSGAFVMSNKKGNLEIEESLAISPRKSLHIVRAFDEKFLVASDATSTTLLARLNSENEVIDKTNVEEFSNYLEPKNQPEKPTRKSGSVIHSMLEKLNN